MIELHFGERPNETDDPRVVLDGVDVTFRCAVVRLLPLGLCSLRLFDDPPKLAPDGNVVDYDTVAQRYTVAVKP